MAGSTVPSSRSYNGRRDKSELAIVHALEAAGYKVFRRLPVDLACRKSYWEPGVVMLIEAKTPLKNGRARKRYDQGKQDAVLKDCGIPRVTTPAAALEAVRAVQHDGDAEI
jgi:hypothetical protein